MIYVQEYILQQKWKPYKYPSIQNHINMAYLDNGIPPNAYKL